MHHTKLKNVRQVWKQFQKANHKLQKLSFAFCSVIFSIKNTLMQIYLFSPLNYTFFKCRNPKNHLACQNILLTYPVIITYDSTSDLSTVDMFHVQIST